MTDGPTVDETRRALAARLRELRTDGLGERPLNRKELGMLLGEAMRRPAGAYAARRVGDFENPHAKSPPPPDALRGYAQVFGRTRGVGSNGELSDDRQDGVAALEDELLTLRKGIDASSPDDPATPTRRWKVVAGISAVMAIGLVSAFLVAGGRDPSTKTFCARNTDIRPSPGSVGVICARDVRLRPSPDAPADQAVAELTSGQRFIVDRYTPSGAWVHGTTRLDNGEDVQGWIQSGWFCPPAGARSTASACE